MSGSFDSVAGAEGAGSTARNERPIWMLDLTSQDENVIKDIHKWLIQEKNARIEDRKEENKEIRTDVALYKGIQYMSQDARQGGRDRETRKKNPLQKIVANNLFDLTENLVARDVKYKPAIAVMPQKDDSYEDEIAAELTQAWLAHIWYSDHFEDETWPELSRCRHVHGGVVCFVEYDPDKGPISPLQAKAEKENADTGGKIPLMKENGEQEIDAQGKPIFIENPVRIGEVSYRTEFLLNVFFDPYARRFRDAKDVICQRVMRTDELRSRYPKAKKISPTSSGFMFDMASLEDRELKGETIYYEYHAKAQRGIAKGRTIIFTDDEILDSKPLPEAYNKLEALPCLLLPGVKIPGELYPRSFYRNVKGLTTLYNHLTNLIARNQMLASHPKWMMPAGAAKIDQLGNDITIVQFRGPVAPKLEQMNPTPGEVFKFREQVKEDFQRLSGVYGISVGEPPKGIEAGIALQFLNEQENDRHNDSTLSVAAFIRDLAILSIFVAAENYKEGDERQLRLLGPNNRWMTQVFDPKNLQKSYDVRLQNSSAFQYSKTAKLNTLLKLNEKFPNQVPADQVLDMVEFAQTDKYISAATTAIRTAEAENAFILKGMGAKIMEPKAYEDLINHWLIHIKPFQEMGFQRVPEQNRKALEDHVRATEYLMHQKGMQNQAFLQRLMQLPLWPIFYVFKPSEVEPDPEMADATIADNANNAGADAGAPPALEEPPLDEAANPVEPQADVNPERDPTQQLATAREPSVEEQINGQEPRPRPLQ